jgi:hypothetical protein
MTFFYDLNKKLNSIRELPETTHQQLNEGAHSQGAMELNPDFRKKPKTGIMGKIAQGAKKVADFVAPGDEDLLRDLERKSGGKRPVKESDGGIDQILAKFPREVEAFKQGGELDADLEEALWDYHYSRGTIRNYNADASEYIAQDLADHLGVSEAATPMTPKQKSFAKLAPPADKITFADKIAGAKKEVDEMLGDVAAEAMKAALGKGKQPVQGMAEAANEFTQADWDKVARKKRHLMVLNRNLEPEDAEQMAAEKLGYDYEDVLAWIESDQNMAEATKEIPGGRRHTSEPGGYGRKSDDDAPKVATKKGRGRPKKGSDSETGEVMKPDWSAFGVGGKVKLPKHKGAVTKHKMVGEGEAADVEAAVKLLKKAGYKVSKGDTEQVDEKAVSKKQQKFMGMVHAAQKGEKPASKEVAKVAKEMPKKEAEKFAKTKHKGLPEKKKKTDETTVAGNVATAESSDAPKEKKSKSSGGINFGGSIYDSVNREVENLIAESMQRLDESMNINMSMNSDAQGGPSKSLTVTATDEDADRLAMLLKMAGMGSEGAGPEAAYAEAPCQVDENQPDWPTEPEYSDDAFQYSGGLNKPKRDVAGDGQATGTITAVHATEEDDEELRRIREMAGIRESKKPDFLDLDKDGDKKESMKKAAKEKDDKEEKVDESIFASTANLWKTYKG